MLYSDLLRAQEFWQRVDARARTLDIARNAGNGGAQMTELGASAQMTERGMNAHVVERVNLGSRIARERRALGMSQEELARAIWVSRNTVSNWEVGATAPDIQSLVLLSGVFGMSLDEMVGRDANATVHALARDREHLLVVAPARLDAQTLVCKADMQLMTGDPIRGGHEIIDFEPDGMTDMYAGYRLVRLVKFFSRSIYELREEGGLKLGTISRKKALWYPVFTLRIYGFGRVVLRRDMGYGHDFKTVYRIEGEDLGFTGNLLGSSFEIERGGVVIARVAVCLAGARQVLSIDLPQPSLRPLAVGVVMMVFLMRDYDSRLVRA